METVRGAVRTLYKISYWAFQCNHRHQIHSACTLPKDGMCLYKLSHVHRLYQSGIYRCTCVLAGNEGEEDETHCTSLYGLQVACTDTGICRNTLLKTHTHTHSLLNAHRPLNTTYSCTDVHTHTHIHTHTHHTPNNAEHTHTCHRIHTHTSKCRTHTHTHTHSHTHTHIHTHIYQRTQHKYTHKLVISPSVQQTCIHQTDRRPTVEDPL